MFGTDPKYTTGVFNPQISVRQNNPWAGAGLRRKPPAAAKPPGTPTTPTPPAQWTFQPNPLDQPSTPGGQPTSAPGTSGPTNPWAVSPPIQPWMFNPTMGGWANVGGMNWLPPGMQQPNGGQPTTGGPLPPYNPSQPQPPLGGPLPPYNPQQPMPSTPLYTYPRGWPPRY